MLGGGIAASGDYAEFMAVCPVWPRLPMMRKSSEPLLCGLTLAAALLSAALLAFGEVDGPLALLPDLAGDWFSPLSLLH